MAKTLSTKDMNRLLSGFEAQGARVVRVNAGYRILAPNGTGSMTIHKSVSDSRGIMNIKQDCRKAGLVWPL